MAFVTGRHMTTPLFAHGFTPAHVTAMVERVFARRVVFHDGDAVLAPGLSVHHVGGHTAGLQVVRVHTSVGWIVLASDSSHYYENMQRCRPFPVVFDVGAMVQGYARLRELAHDLPLPSSPATIRSCCAATRRPATGLAGIGGAARRRAVRGLTEAPRPASGPRSVELSGRGRFPSESARCSRPPSARSWCRRPSPATTACGSASSAARSSSTTRPAPSRPDAPRWNMRPATSSASSTTSRSGRSSSEGELRGDEYRLVQLRQLYGSIPEPQWIMAGRAEQISTFDPTHRFCGQCGGPTEAHPTDRARRCPSCGHMAFPRLTPAVIMRVTRGDEILLAHGRLFPGRFFSTLAGFVEPGETWSTPSRARCTRRWPSASGGPPTSAASRGRSPTR